MAAVSTLHRRASTLSGRPCTADDGDICFYPPAVPGRPRHPSPDQDPSDPAALLTTSAPTTRTSEKPDRPAGPQALGQQHRRALTMRARNALNGADADPGLECETRHDCCS